MKGDMKKGGGLALLLGGKSDEGEGGDDLEDAMSDLAEALADKDFAAAAMAFKRAHEVCCEDYDDEDDDEEE